MTYSVRSQVPEGVAVEKQALDGPDFFVSYTRSDEAWALWIAAILESAGYTVLLQALDFRPGHDFLYKMQQAVTEAARTIAVLSPAYFASEFAESEWRAAFAKDPTGEQGLLVPVRVHDCKPPGLLATRIYIDLVNANEARAKAALLDGVKDRGAGRPQVTSQEVGSRYRSTPEA